MARHHLLLLLPRLLILLVGVGGLDLDDHRDGHYLIRYSESNRRVTNDNKMCKYKKSLNHIICHIVFPSYLQSFSAWLFRHSMVAAVCLLH